MNVFKKQQNALNEKVNEHDQRAFQRGIELHAAGLIKDNLAGKYLEGWEWAEANLKPRQVADIRALDALIRGQEVVTDGCS